MVRASNETEVADLAKRIFVGDEEAEAEMVHRYKDGVFVIISRIVHSRSVAEDVSQEAFKKVIEKIRSGHLREPERLSGFISAIAKNLAIDHVRKQRRSVKEIEIKEPEQIADPAPNPFEQLWRKERAAIVRRVIGELKIKRDREVLLRYYIGEEDKDQVCDALGLTTDQFNWVVFRALRRYKELYEKIVGEHQ